MSPKRHLIIPDAQIKPGANTEHVDWAARAIVEYQPDVVVCIGDWWDFPSLNSHSKSSRAPDTRKMLSPGTRHSGDSARR